MGSPYPELEGYLQNLTRQKWARTARSPLTWFVLAWVTVAVFFLFSGRERITHLMNGGVALAVIFVSLLSLRQRPLIASSREMAGQISFGLRSEVRSGKIARELSGHVRDLLESCALSHRTACEALDQLTKDDTTERASELANYFMHRALIEQSNWRSAKSQERHYESIYHTRLNEAKEEVVAVERELELVADQAHQLSEILESLRSDEDDQKEPLKAFLATFDNICD